MRFGEASACGNLCLIPTRLGPDCLHLQGIFVDSVEQVGIINDHYFGKGAVSHEFFLEPLMD